MVKAAWTQTKHGQQDIIDEDNGGRWILAQGSRWEVGHAHWLIWLLFDLTS